MSIIASKILRVKKNTPLLNMNQVLIKGRRKEKLEKYYQSIAEHHRLNDNTSLFSSDMLTVIQVIL
jgi:hypothetical protein